jgi:hypothetical protein
MGHADSPFSCALAGPGHKWFLPWLVHGTAPVIAARRRHRPRQEMIGEILGLHSITDPHGCLVRQGASLGWS